MSKPERRMLAGFLGVVVGVAAVMLFVFAAIGRAIVYLRRLRGKLDSVAVWP